jgi:hypothetical protein
MPYRKFNSVWQLMPNRAMLCLEREVLQPDPVRVSSDRSGLEPCSDAESGDALS